MKLVWIFGVTFNLIASIYAGPVEVVYNGDGCDCQSRLSPSYQTPLPTYPLLPPYKPTSYGYNIDAPQVQTKAKVTYTFDFIVEEPKPTYAKKPKKLNLHAKVDRIALNKPDCTDSYISQPLPPPPPPPPPQETPAPSLCNCGKCGSTMPLYRYVDEQVVQPCNCGCPTCKCHLQYPNSINIGTPVLTVSGSSHEGRTNSRRKRDLEQIFFRPRRQNRVRSPRYTKLYKKPINDEKENEKENWFNLDFFSDAFPLKRYSKRSLHPDFRSRIVKRDIKGEYDLLEKERQEADLTLPEIIQFMPETLQPNFKRGSCLFGYGRNLVQSNSESKQTDDKDEIFFKVNRKNNEIEKPSTSRTPSIDGDNDINEPENAKAGNSFAKRNANDFRQYQIAMPPTVYSDMAPKLNDYNTKIPTQNSNNQCKLSAGALCKQRNLYAAMRRSAESQYNYGGNRGYKYIPNPPRLIAAPEPPLLGALKYPVQYNSKGSLDRIISDIVYRHPGFIEASSHYGGALVDPTSEQVEQTKGYVKKLIDGRFGLLFDKSQEQYTPLYPRPNYGGPSYNPNIYSRPMSYIPTAFY